MTVRTELNDRENYRVYLALRSLTPAKQKQIQHAAAGPRAHATPHRDVQFV